MIWPKEWFSSMTMSTWSGCGTPFWARARSTEFTERNARQTAHPVVKPIRNITRPRQRGSWATADAASQPHSSLRKVNWSEHFQICSDHDSLVMLAPCPAAGNGSAGFPDEEVAQGQDLQVASVKHLEGVVGRTDHRFAAAVERGIEQQAQAGARFKFFQQLVIARIA